MHTHAYEHKFVMHVFTISTATCIQKDSIVPVSPCVSLTCMISVLAKRLSRGNVKENHRLVDAARTDLGVVPRALSIQHFMSMASVGLEEESTMRVPQLHRLVTATGQAVATVSYKKRDKKSARKKQIVNRTKR